MEQNRSHEFRERPGMVSPLILDNFARSILPLWAQLEPEQRTIVSPDGQTEIALAVVSREIHNKEYSLVVQPAKVDDRILPDSVIRTYHFMNRGQFYTETSYGDGSFEATAVHHPDGVFTFGDGRWAHRSGSMSQQNLQQILEILIASEAISSPYCQAMLSRLQKTHYEQFSSKENYANYLGLSDWQPIALAHIETAIQIIAADNKQINSAPTCNREAQYEEDDRIYSSAFCLESRSSSYKIENWKSGAYFNRTEFAHVTEEHLSANEERISFAENHIPGDVDSHLNRTTLLEAVREDRLRFRREVSYEYFPGQVLNRRVYELYDLYDSAQSATEAETEDQEVGLVESVRLTSHDASFALFDERTSPSPLPDIGGVAMAGSDQIKGLEHWDEFLGGLTQAHVEEITDILRSLGLAPYPPRWG